MEPVEEYQILFNVSADRDDFFTENDWEYEDMMDELTKEGKLDDISQCVKKTYIWDEELEQYVEDDVEILYDNILDETKKKTESKEKFNKAELQAVKQSIDTALDDLQLTASGTTGDYEDKLLRDELRDTSNFVGRYIGRMTESKMLEDGLDLSKIYSIQNYADVMTDKVIADMKYNERDKITIDDIINVIDDNINDTDIFSILCAEEREIYDKYFNEETIDELKDLWDNQSYAEEQFIDMVKDRVQKNGYTVYDEYNESKKVTESKKLTEGKYEDTLETNVAVKVLDYYTNTLGFDEDEAVDYFDTEVKSDKDTIEVEVRADLSYDDFDRLLPRLNRIVQAYDKEAYFDMVESGIARAVIDKNAYNRDKHSKIKADKERYAKEVEESKKVTESKYIVCSYYDEKLHGLEDELKTDDFSEATDFAHEKLMQGNMVEIENTESGKYKRINPDEYAKDFDGEFIVSYEELEESKKTESKALKREGYQVWQKYYEDGKTTTEYVQSFDTFEQAQKFADGLNQDPDCEAWVQEDKLTEAVEVCGGDKINYLMFYTSNYGTYKDNTADNIAQYGKEHLEGLKDLSIEEIKDKHLYWASEIGYHSAYNGDTYVLFDDIEKLPEDMKQDAIENCKGCKKTEGITEVPDDLYRTKKSNLLINPKEKGNGDLWKVRFGLFSHEIYNTAPTYYVYAKDESDAIGKTVAFIQKHSDGPIDLVRSVRDMEWYIRKNFQDEYYEYAGIDKYAKDWSDDVPTELEFALEKGFIPVLDDTDLEYDCYINGNGMIVERVKDKKTETIDEVEDYGPYYVKEFNESGTDMDTIGFETEQEATDYAREQLKKRPNYEYAVYETETDECLYVYNSKDENKKKTEAVDTEEKAKEVKEKVEQDIQNQGTENLVDTTEELYDKLKKEIYAYAKQQGLDLEKLRKQGIELESIADTIDDVVGDMVSKTVIEYMDTTGKDIMWDFNISNNDIQVIIQ